MTDVLKDLQQLGALSALAPELASTMARVASDIALVIDSDGIIRNVAEGAAPLAPSSAAWIGQRWVDTVTSDTRPKIQRLLDEVQASGVTRRREVNHLGPSGDEIPVAWAAIRLGEGGPVVAVGRDLRVVATIQQRFLDAQQEMERDYWRRRQSESRYRLLFQVASDAVFVVDASTLIVLEANDAALALLGRPADELIGRPLPDSVPAASRLAATELLTAAGATGRAGEIRLRKLAGDGSADMSATPFRVGDTQQLLVRARRDDSASGAAGVSTAAAEFVEQTPDAVVITDSSGGILFANRAFLTLAGQQHESALKGRLLPELLGDADGRWHALLLRTRAMGIVPRVPLTVRVAGGESVAVDATSTLLTEGEQESVGFTLRPVTHTALMPMSPVDDLFNGLMDLSSQLGRVPLTDLLAEITHRAERHLIESALGRAAGQVPIAAEMLGITPEALVLRLRRHALSAQAHGRHDGLPQSIN